MSDNKNVRTVQCPPGGRITTAIRGSTPKLGILALGLLVSGSALAGSVVGSRHDLSTGGGGMWGSTDEDQVCVFCHTPHNADPTIDAPLWNHATPSGTTFKLYDSATFQGSATQSQPASVSLACLSCHDGIMALNQLLNWGSTGAMPTMDPLGDQLGDIYYPGPYGSGKNITGNYNANPSVNDLSNDHPISFTFDAALITADDPAGTGPYLQIPAAGDAVTLYNGDQVECNSCHNVHDPDITPFLVKSNANSELCLTCHIK